MLAPGHAITSNGEPTSALYAAYLSIRAGASHMRLNGTSMAAAATAGAAILMIEAHRQTHANGPVLSPSTIKASLQYTATPLGASSFTGVAPDALTQGAGAINVPAALMLARGIDVSRPPGGRWGDAVEWFAGETMGPDVVWDGVIDWAANIAWGPELVGSASGTSDQTYVWGYADSPATTTWGNLQTVPGGGQTFVWGNGSGATP